MKKRKQLENTNKVPTVTPRRTCYLRLLRLTRVHDYLLLEKASPVSPSKLSHRSA